MKNELFQIGEVARMFNLSVGTLRHYETLGLVTPEYTDPQTGYRYYSTRQFEVLNTVRYLRALDMPLGKISDFLKNRDIDKMRDLLREQKRVLIEKQAALKTVERKIDNRLSQLDDALTAPLAVPERVKLPKQRYALLRSSLAPKSYLDLEASIRSLDRGKSDAVVFLGKVGLGISPERLRARECTSYDSVFLLLDDEDSFAGETATLPECECVSVHFNGSHAKAGEYYEMLLDYIDANSLSIGGASREITMIDDGFTNDESRFVTKIQIPIK